MKLLDIISMAIHNLRRRPMRTLLNLLGVTLTAILMTAAGSQGVKDSLHSLLENSEFSRKLVVSFDSIVRASDLEQSEWKVEADISQQRIERLQAALKSHILVAKRRELGRWRLIDLETLETLEQVEAVQDVVPAVRLNFDFVKDEFVQIASGLGVSPDVLGLPDRIIAGEMIGEDDFDQVLIHELLAYQMGFATPAELDSLIGTEITTVFAADENKPELSTLLRSLETGNIGRVLEDQSELLSAITAIVGDVDLSALTEQQKKLIRKSLKAWGAEETTKQEQLGRNRPLFGFQKVHIRYNSTSFVPLQNSD